MTSAASQMAAAALFLLKAVALVVAGASLFGWGIVAQRLTGLSRLSWPVTTALGVASVLAIGGILNLAKIAFAPALWSVAAAGWLAFALRETGSEPMFARMARAVRSCTVSERVEGALAFAFIVAVIGFAIGTQLPPNGFNEDDDLQKYFSHPVRMLATGTVFGSPLSSIGAETLGGAAFLHGFVLSVLPVGFINGIDAVFGLALLLCLGAVAGWRRFAPLPGALLVPLLIACIEPLYVNISPLYLLAALIAATALLMADARPPPPAAALGLLYAGLVALKPTAAVFIGGQLCLLTIAVCATRASVRAGASWALRALAWSALALAPWILLNLPHFLDAGPAAAAVAPAVDSPPSGLLSFETGIYGRSLGLYAVLAALVLVVALARLLFRPRGGTPDERWRVASLIAAALAAAGAWGIVVLVLARHVSGIEASVRYTMPFLLGVLPAIALLLAALTARQPMFARAWLPAGALLAVCAAFAPSLVDRYATALKYRSILAYLPPQVSIVSPDAFARHFDALLSDARRSRLRSLQHLIPAGAPFVAWVGQPFHLDFARNPILDVDPAGLASRWARVPENVRYVLWDRRNWARQADTVYTWSAGRNSGLRDRAIAARVDAFTREFSEEFRAGTVLHQDDDFVVFRRPQG